MIYVTSDLHGYPLPALLRLLDSAGFSDTDDLIILGDVIDRNGDGGVGTLRWMLQQVNVRMLLGNHEAMLLSCRFLFDTVTEESLAGLDPEKLRLLSAWMANGADMTLRALRELFHRDPDTGTEILEYLRDAPFYEVAQTPGRTWLLTHSGLGRFSPGKRLSEYAPEDFLWNRPSLEDRYFQKTVTVFGHTPTAFYGAQYAGRMLRTPTWIDVDTGAGSGGSPMLLRLDDERAFYA